MRGNTLRMIEQGRPLCAEIFSWNGYPAVKKNYRFDTQLRVWRRSCKPRIRNCRRPKDYSQSCVVYEVLVWTKIEIEYNLCISLWEGIRFINWASLFSQTKSHLSLQQGRKMAKRWQEVTDSIHRNISRSFQALSDWTWNVWWKWYSPAVHLQGHWLRQCRFALQVRANPGRRKLKWILFCVSLHCLQNLIAAAATEWLVEPY